MKFVLLISCMHQHDHSILQRSNVQSDVVVVNQCDCNKVENFDFVNKFGQTKHCTFVSTTERGLSRSRNMAISYAPDDAICKVCDDDETFADDVEQKVFAGYRRMPDASLIVFSVIRNDLNYNKTYPQKDMRLNFSGILNSSSVQLTFRKNIIDYNKVRFDEKMGSGTRNGGGEENKFMFDIRRAGGKLYYASECISTLNPGKSQWFKGFTKNYMQNMGWASRRTLGSFLGIVYIHYFTIKNINLYRKEISPVLAYYNLLKGFISKR